MKTKNNIQKTIFNSLAVGASVVLISVTVNAQYYWNAIAENHSFTKSETALVEKSKLNPVAANSESSYASLLAKENEEPLELENWMMNDRYFSISLKEEVDTPLNLENWMTNEKVFYGSSMNLEVETDAALELESWMTNENNFNVSSFQLIEENDAKLKLEEWMLNENLFNRAIETEQPLQMEDWMLSETIWII